VTTITFRHVLHACSVAARAHEGQRRKDEKTPYVSHVFRVCMILRDLFDLRDPRMLCAAVLHDTIEDTKSDFDDLVEDFSPEVAKWVALLTKDKRMQDGPREAEYLQQLQGAEWQVKACKLADVYDNLLDQTNLPADRRGRSLQRAKHYLEGLSQNAAPELKIPLELTWELYRERSA
jgi:guanosine-3',5'-bis(diphosphate) 3'-pyrophosphohydrolase